ncbi:NAD(P)-binding domain-containing protein [soil metagenome]
MYSNKTNIGIIGSGIVGQVLAKAFFWEGNPVMLGTRDTTKPDIQKWQAENTGVAIGSFDATAQFADIIVLAVGGSVAEAALQLAGIANFDEKIVIDATNPISKTPPVNGVLSFFTTYNESLMERIQALLPNAFVIKAFNSVGNAVMYKPKFRETPTMFICGNNQAAKESVSSILTAFGWEIADMGAVEAARAIEPLCILWCIPGMLQNEWYHAFKLLKP